MQRRALSRRAAGGLAFGQGDDGIQGSWPVGGVPRRRGRGAAGRQAARGAGGAAVARERAGQRRAAGGRVVGGGRVRGRDQDGAGVCVAAAPRARRDRAADVEPGGLPAVRAARRARSRALRAPGRGRGPGSDRRATAGRWRATARGAAAMAGSGAGRPGRRAVRAGRDRAAGRTAPGGPGDAHRGRPGSRSTRRVDRRAATPGRRASVARATAWPADAGPIPLRSAGRRTPGLHARAQRARGSARDRTGAGAARPAPLDPRAGRPPRRLVYLGSRTRRAGLPPRRTRSSAVRAISTEWCSRCASRIPGCWRLWDPAGSERRASRSKRPSGWLVGSTTARGSWSWRRCRTPTSSAVGWRGCSARRYAATNRLRARWRGSWPTGTCCWCSTTSSS